MFEINAIHLGEASNWITNENLTDAVTVPGLSPNFPQILCTPFGADGQGSDICLIITDQGYSNAATSMTALLHSNLFDFTNTYFVVAGIAGVNPRYGTLGAAAWARFAIDYGLNFEIDAREMEPGWPYGYTGFGPVPPGVKPTRTIGTEVYQLNESLLQKAYSLSKDVVLLDNVKSQTTRAKYTDPHYKAAMQPPSVMICDSVAIDTYWHGQFLSQRADDWAKLLTNGAGKYCMTDEEDNATLTALKRASQAGLVNFDRVAVLRTASNFDQQDSTGTQSAYQSLVQSSGGFIPSLVNAYRVGSALAHNIVADWHDWKDGVPGASAASGAKLAPTFVPSKK